MSSNSEYGGVGLDDGGNKWNLPTQMIGRGRRRKIEKSSERIPSTKQATVGHRSQVSQEGDMTNGENLKKFRHSTYPSVSWKLNFKSFAYLKPGDYY